MLITQHTKDKAQGILTALLANPKVVYSNAGGQVKLPPGLTKMALELALELESDFNCLEQRIDKREARLGPFTQEKK